VKDLKITTTKRLRDNFNLDNFVLTYCEILQLVYKNNEYYINRHYINLGENIEVNGLKIDNFEIVISGDYTFHVFNIFIDNDIYSFDMNGNMIYTYDLRKRGDTAMTKSNGDIYYIPGKPINDTFSDEDNLFLEQNRKSWGNSLLTYSHRIDGRICFYIRLKKEINFIKQYF
jgi:hypothetical protein